MSSQDVGEGFGARDVFLLAVDGVVLVDGGQLPGGRTGRGRNCVGPGDEQLVLAPESSVDLVGCGQIQK
jgi:hypothetical protein